MFTEQGPFQSFASIHDVSKVYHSVIRLINGTAVEHQTWLKCKYPNRPNDSVELQKMTSFPLEIFQAGNGCRGCKYIEKDADRQQRTAEMDADIEHAGSFRVLIKWFEVMLNIISREILQANQRLHTKNTETVWPKSQYVDNSLCLYLVGPEYQILI